MEKYGKFYTYENPRLGKLSMLVIGQTAHRDQIDSLHSSVFGALPVMDFDEDYSKSDILSANHIVINRDIDTKDGLRKQVEYAREVLENPHWDMHDENQYMAEVMFYNTSNPDVARLRTLVTNSNFRHRENAGGYGLGKDIVQGATKEITSQGFRYIKGNSTEEAVSFYKHLDFDIEKIIVDTPDTYRRTHGKFITSVTNPKLIIPNKFQLDARLTGLATEMINK